MAHSATSGACFALGTGLMFATGLPVIARRPAAVHVLVLMIALAGGFTMLFGGDADVVHAMGRQTDFTGRTAIWKAVIPMAPNPVVGAGFESFWLGPRLQRLWHMFPVIRPNEAHDGYIEVYLNLGCVGVGLIALILMSGYWHAVAAFRRDPGLGGLMLAYVAAAAIYSVTEAGFRLLDPIWIFLLLAVVAAGGIASDARRRTPRPLRAASDQASRVPPSDTHALIPSGRTIETF
jgi:O-antigen ligase